MRALCWFMSFMIVLGSTQSAYAASSSGWTASTADTLMAGATATITAFKGAGSSAMKATISYKPTALAVGKEIVKGGGLLAVAYAMSELLGAGVDWVLDPANNSVKYKPTAADDGTVDAFGTYTVVGGAGGNPSASTARAACSAYVVAANAKNAAVTGGLATHKNPVATASVCAFDYTADPKKSSDSVPYSYPISFKPSAESGIDKDGYKHIPIQTVAAKVISNADNGHVDSQEFIKSVAVGGVNAGDMDVPLDSVAEPTTDTPSEPVDPAKPYDDSGVLDLLKKLVAAVVGLWSSFGEFVGFMNSDLPPEKGKDETAIDVTPPAVPTKSASEFDVDYVSFGGSCPAMPSANISIMGINAPLSFDMTPLCDLAVSIRPAVLAIAYFVGLGVVASAIRET